MALNVKGCHFYNNGAGILTSLKTEVNLTDSSFAGNDIGVAMMGKISPKLVKQLRLLAEANTPPEKIEPGVLARFKKAGIDIMDWVGRGKTLYDIYQMVS